VPVIGKIFTGDKKHGGIISAPYKIKDSYWFYNNNGMDLP
jgi:hypothetical protein